MDKKNLKENELLCKRLKELSFFSFHRNMMITSDFLNLHEINLLHSIEQELSGVPMVLYGGHGLAERKVAVWGTEPDLNRAISSVFIQPLHAKYAEQLNHRDFLGSILNLGIERCKIGDIITKNSCAYVFCASGMSQFLEEQLIKVKNTSVQCTLCHSNLQEVDFEPEYQCIKGSVASERIDSFLSVALGESRTNAVTYITSGRIFVNGLLINSQSHIIKENDLVSVRGKGRFLYKGIVGQSKKGRYNILIYQFV